MILARLLGLLTREQGPEYRALLADLAYAPTSPTRLESSTSWAKVCEAVPVGADGFASSRFLLQWPAGGGIDWRVIYEGPGGLSCVSSTLLGTNDTTGTLQRAVTGCWRYRLEAKLNTGSTPINVNVGWSRDLFAGAPSA